MVLFNFLDLNSRIYACTHMRMHTYICMYVYIYVCVCICVCMNAKMYLFFGWVGVSQDVRFIVDTIIILLFLGGGNMTLFKISLIPSLLYCILI